MKKGYILLVLLFLVGCIDSRECVGLLDEAERQMLDCPDSAKITLESIVRCTLRTRKSRARFALLYSQALDKNCIDVDRDSLACVATTYYRSRGNQNEKALAFYYRGRVYENAQKADSAIIFYNQAEQYIAKTKNFYLKGLIANALAGMYSSQRFSMLAKDKYLEAAGYFERINHKKNMLINYAGAISHFGTAEESNICDYCLNHAESIALELKDTVTLIGLARFRAYRALEEHADYNLSLKILRKASSEYCNNRAEPSYYLILSKIYLNLDKPDSAFLYLRPLIKHTSGEHNRRRAEILYVAGAICKAQNKYEEAYKYSYEAMCINDSIYFAEKDWTIPELKAKYRNEQLVLRNQYLKKIGLYQVYVALTVLVAILSSALWLINRRQQKIRQQKQEIAEYREAMFRLKDEYEALQRDSRQNESAIDEGMLVRRIEFLKQLLEIASNFKHDKDKFQEKIEGLLTKNGSRKETNEVLPMFRDLMNMRHPGIIGFMTEKYPLITDSEVSLYCMICMGVAKSAICMVLGCREKTYYNYRNLLRNKLHITNDDMSIRDHYRWLCSEYRKSKEI